MGQDVGVDWEVVSTPFAADLEATTHAADGAYAVGEGGIVVTGDKIGRASCRERVCVGV